jgi:hypothetical protein
MRIPLSEKIKNIILVVLILSSTILTYRLWFNDHNLFSILGVFSNSKVAHQNGLELINLPPRILINLGDNSHVMVRSNYTEYSPLQKEGVKIIKSMLQNQKFETVDGSAWNGLLSSKSILFGYNAQLNTALLQKLFNVNNLNLNNIENVKDILVVQDNSVSDNLKCYIRDEKQNKIYKFQFSYNDTNLINLIAQIESKNLDNYVTGYEVKHKLLKDDVLFLLSDSAISEKNIDLTNEINISSNSEVHNFAERFFEKFNVVKSVEYKDDTKTNTIQKEFIDRKRILKIYANGLIEYTSAEVPDDKTGVDLYTALKSALDFAGESADFPQNIYISEIKEFPGSDYIFDFDYTINGFEVKTNGLDLPKHAIEVEVKGNVVSSYRRFVKNFTLGKQVNLDITNLEAMNQAIKLYTDKTGQKVDKSVNDIKLVYLDNGTFENANLYWYIEVGNEPFLINAVNKEN